LIILGCSWLACGNASAQLMVPPAEPMQPRTGFTLPDQQLSTDLTAPVPRSLLRELILRPATHTFADLEVRATTRMAFFCRLEASMEKAARLPVRFRLGDVQYNDYLEGKIEGWRWGW
jgi:hypothetical protein